MNVAAIILITPLGEWGGLMGNQYLMNISALFTCVPTVLGFVAATTWGTWRLLQMKVWWWKEYSIRLELMRTVSQYQIFP